MSYRVEIAAGGRAGCQATHCKKEGIKIQKGEIRQGTLVTIQEHASMRWRHWGCVTPTVLHNWKESCEMDMELVDGYDDLPQQAQDKVQRALEQVHVDDEDWNGDKEMNRFDEAHKNQGMFVKQSKKKKAEEDSEDEGAAEKTSPPKKQASKKRGRAQAEDEDESESAPKKGRGRKAAKVEASDESEQPAPARKGRKGKAPKDNIAELVDSDPIPVPAAGKSKGRKPKSAPVVESETGEAPAAEASPARAPAKKSRAKKGTAKPVDSGDVDGESPEVKLQRRPRKSKKSAASDD